MNPFDHKSKAANTGELGNLGSPQRWGSYQSFYVDVDTLADTGYIRGDQAIMVTFGELLARSIDLLATYEIRGIETTDGPFAADKLGFTGFGLEVQIGAGQATAMARLGAALPGPPVQWATVTERLHITQGVLQSLIPMPGASLNVTPVFRVVGGDIPAHRLEIRTYVFACPRNA